MSRVGPIVLLTISAVALALAPLVVGDDYSWIEHTTSEAAGQVTDGAWMARIGFLLFGSAVLRISSLARSSWGVPATWMHRAFGGLMIAAAAFSSRPFLNGMGFDQTEDLLHSVAATGMGFAFALGVLLVSFRPRSLPRRLFDIVAIAVSVFLPIWMGVAPGYAGVLQRVIFAIAYLWYGVEAWSSGVAHTGGDPVHGEQQGTIQIG